MRYLLVGVLVLAGLAGCGGSDSEDEDPGRATAPSAEARPPNDEFVRRVDGLCKEVKPELAQIMTAITEARDAARAGRVPLPQTFDTFATLLRKASVSTDRFRAGLRGIEVPPKERRFHDSLLGSVEEGAANLRRQVSAAEAQDASRLRDLSVQGSVISARGKGLLAGHGGFRFCGRG